jgi:hypothetical protein
MSATAADLRALTSAYNQMIDVTAVNKDGQMASGYVSLYLYNGMTTGGTTIYGSLNSRDNAANIRPGSSADYYSILGSGATNVLDLEGDFDTYLALYDTNLNAIAVNDDVIPGLNLNSQLANFLTNGVTYYVEATSLSNSTAGNFSINSDTDALMPIPSPFVSGGSCGSIAGDYSVNETLVISLTFNGQRYSLTNVSSASVTITQTGCDFTYPVVDPTGTIPPTLLMGRIDYNDLELYSEAIIPQTSELFITSSSVTGTGLSYGGGLTMEATGTVTGSYLGVPFQLDFKSTSTFSK